jgi:hypothetical protein
MSEDNEDTTGKDGYFAMPRTAQTKTKVTKVEVTRISIPFVDVLVLTFQALFASLFVLAIPIAFIFYMIINS